MEENPLVLGLQWEAKESKIAINVGIHIQANNGKILNRSCWIDEHGYIVSFYDKLHLFDYGALKESNSVEAGKKVVPPVDTVVGRVGLTICFDVSESRPLGTLVVLFNTKAAPLPRKQPCTEASKCSIHHLSISIYSSHG